MLSIQGIYDGKRLKLLQRVNIFSPQKVIITFMDSVEDEITSEEIHYLTEKSGAFDFLSEKGEDIYSDKNLKVKY